MKPLLWLLFLSLSCTSAISQSAENSTNGMPITTAPTLTPEEMRQKILMFEILKSQQKLIEDLGLSLDDIKKELEATQKTNKELKDDLKDMKNDIQGMKDDLAGVKTALTEERKEAKKKALKSTLKGTIIGAALAALLIAVF